MGSEGSGGKVTPPSIGRTEEIPAAGAAPKQATEQAPKQDKGPRITEDVVRATRCGAAGPRGLSHVEESDLRSAARETGAEKPVATPWNSVNEALGDGLWPGLYVLVGATGAGKSQWALQLGLSAAMRAGVPVMCIMLELDAYGVHCRLLATIMHEQGGRRAQWSAIYRGKARATREAKAALAALPFHVIEADAHGFGYDEITHAVEAFRKVYPRESHPSALVVFDFLQLVSSPVDVPRQEIRERITHAAYRCRVAARDHSVAMVALSSAARQDKSNNPLVVGRDKEGAPVRAALHELVGLGKESGDVEYSADGVLVLCREPWEASKPQGGKVVHLAVAKLRAGEGSWCALRFDGTVFADDVTEDGPAGGADEVSPGAPRGKRGVRK